MELTGSGPWHLTYLLTATDGAEPATTDGVLELSRDDDNMNASVSPPGPGNYDFQVVRVTDANYEDVPVAGVRKKFRLFQVPVARFPRLGQQDRHLCQASSLAVPVEIATRDDHPFGGPAPYILDYRHDIASSDGTHTHDSQQRLSGIRERSLAIEFKNLTLIGKHTLTLRNVMDAHECSSHLDVQEVFHVHGQPTAALDCPHVPVIRDGAPVDLRLILKGTPPWTVVYRKREEALVEEGDTTEVVVEGIEKSNTIITSVGHPGSYELVSVRDRFCTGVVQQTQCIVTAVDAPKLTAIKALDSAERCAPDTDDPLFFDASVAVSGKGPWQMGIRSTYHPDPLATDLNGPEAEMRYVEVVMTDPSHHLAGTLNFTRPGTYRYEVHRMSDAEFDHVPVHVEPRALTYRVHPLPDVQFHTEPVPICMDALQCSGPKDRIVSSMTLDYHAGVSTDNYTLTLKVVSPSGEAAFAEYGLPGDGHQAVMDLPMPLCEPGTYTVHLTDLRNSRGCHRTLRDTAVEVVVSVPPQVVMPSKGYSCVGEYIDFGFTGAGPWTMDYSLGGESVTTRAVHGPTFTAYAARPGTLSVLGVRNAGCPTTYQPGDRDHILRDLPRAIVNGGENDHRKIIEGTQTEFTVRFTGVPPFGFTYQRVVDGRSWVHRVQDIQAREYRVPVRDAGRYTVLEVHDLYCKVSIAELPGMKQQQERRSH